mmetsp:Transcript_78512/g.139215  ORF Transcript_78512/g.139215 Transcript_78512/m.139215 type:complete len:482 (+) Transcript_78512:82-1527(+)
MAGKWALLSLYLALIVDNLGGFMVVPSLPFVVTDVMHGTPAQYGLMQSAFAAMQVLGTLVMGKVSDAVGRRVVMLVCLSTTGLTLIAFGQVQRLPGLLFFRSLDGFFSGTIGVAQAFLADLVEPAERAGAMAKAGACIGLGLVLGPALGGTAAGFGDFAFVCNCAAGITLFNFVIALLSLPGVAPSTTAVEEVAEASVWKLVCQDAMLPGLYVTMFLQMLTMSFFTSMLALSLKDRYDINASTMGRILFVAGMTMVLAQMLLAKRFSALLGQRNCVIFGNLLRAVDLVLMALITSPVMPYAVPMVFTFTSALLLPNMAALTASRAPETQRGVIMGGLQSIGGLASAIGPTIGGQIYDRNPKMVWWTAAAVAVCAALAVMTFREEKEAQTDTKKKYITPKMRRNSTLKISECAGPDSAGLQLPMNLMTPDSGGAWGVDGDLFSALSFNDKLTRRKTFSVESIGRLLDEGEAPATRRATTMIY